MTRRRSFDPSKLPLAVRQRIAAQHPEHARSVGILPADIRAIEAANPRERARAEKSGKANRHGRKTWVGGISFASAGEAECFRVLRMENPIVFAHGKCSLTPRETMSADGNTLAPDFIVGRIVNRDERGDGLGELMPVLLAPGEFVGRVVDYKAEWADGRGRKKPHIERDFKVKMQALLDWFKVRLWIRTKRGYEE